MRYLLFIATDTEPGDPPEAEHELADWLAEGERRGIRHTGEALRPPAEARTVRVRDGDVMVVDGPFAETTEWIAGFDILECASIEEAVDYASRHPMARRGRIEVRAFDLVDD